MDWMGSQENTAAEPCGARAAASGRGGGCTVAIPPASNPATSISPSASGSLALTEASPRHPTQLSRSPTCPRSPSSSLSAPLSRVSPALPRSLINLSHSLTLALSCRHQIISLQLSLSPSLSHYPPPPSLSFSLSLSLFPSLPLLSFFPSVSPLSRLS